MSNPAPHPDRVGPATLITVKVLHNDNTRRFKVPLRDLGAQVLPQKLRQLLGVPPDVNVIFERYSDSAGCYVRLDTDNIAVYKQLYRAAKAKLKLRIKITMVDEPEMYQPEPQENFAEQPNPRYSYLETVLSSPLPTSSQETVANGATLNIPETEEATPGEPQPLYRDFHQSDEHLSFPVVSHKSPTGLFCIDCNQCGRSIPNEHYHCSICADGDYDLCMHCVDSGVSCENDDHWLIKRVVSDGVVTNSTTETLAPRKAAVQQFETQCDFAPELISEKVPEAPVAPMSLPKVEERICNSCLKEFDESKIVTCSDCDDYDLCITCLLKDQHGHHPAHPFSLVQDRKFCLRSLVLSRCRPGRRYQHAAICDGCESCIIGVRHKCLACPDWDLCTECVANAPQIHPGHRFVPIYDAISEPVAHRETHYGILCDGPLCKDKAAPSYITGTRYKCSVCYDTDFCAKCEAMPTNSHNRTHPMVMFKTPVRSVTISTINENTSGSTIAVGDRVQKSTSTQANAPVEKEVPEEKPVAKVEEPKPVEKDASEQKKSTPLHRASDYQAFFIRDTIRDGTLMTPNTVFQQTWTLYNPGPLAWPEGSQVRFVGGDAMFNVDTEHPSSLSTIQAAMGSNKLLKTVEPGESADFTVSLKTPSREGVGISYWRLKLSNGMPFGHRLWVEVMVRSELPAPVAAESEAAKPEEAQKTPRPREFVPTETTRSGMIFPTLDKETPETSTHNSVATAPSAPSVSNPSVSNPSERDILEEVESLTLEDAETDAGFLTDEEYDVLDASDQEYLDAQTHK